MNKYLIVLVMCVFSSIAMADGWGWYGTAFSHKRLDMLMDDETKLSVKVDVLDSFRSYIEKYRYAGPNQATSTLKYIFLTGAFKHPIPEKQFDHWWAFDLLIYSRVDPQLTPVEYSSESLPPKFYYDLYTLLKDEPEAEVLRSFRYGKDFNSSTPHEDCLTTKKKSEKVPWMPICTEAFLILNPKELDAFVSLLMKAQAHEEYFHDDDMYYIEEMYKYSLSASQRGLSLFFKGNN
ncbi:hypothetical protein [Neptuniibacter sp. QD34_54]|uniref:hypothetical protein n=1 Tax=Neptuniibacter sp. QD34_54 TaxID=3398208 RepID=UPI0039F491DB